MSFRRRIVLLAAAAVAVAIALAAGITYVVGRHELRGGVDASLRDLSPKVYFVSGATAQAQTGVRRSDTLGKVPLDGKQPFIAQLPRAPLGVSGNIVQATAIRGDVLTKGPKPVLPVTSEVRAVAAHKRAPFYRDATVHGVHLRIFSTTGPQKGVVVQIATPLTGVDDALGRLRWILFAVALGGVGLAAAFGVAVSRVATRPLGHLTAAAERVTATGDLDHRIEGEGDDEPGRLAAAFNEMLAALSASRDAQRQLVADASHELRTPLTAIRANIELLERARDLPPPERAETLAAVRGQLEDLTILVGDLVDLARPGERPNEAPEELRLDELVSDAVARAQRHAPQARFAVVAEPCVVHGSRARLARAVGNLLDNAIKWSPPTEPIEVAVNAGEVTVRDHGPGIDEADLPHVFDRFYRATAARGMPGSGLGLAIVKQVADTHGGSVSAAGAPGGGARLRLALPVSALSQTS